MRLSFLRRTPTNYGHWHSWYAWYPVFDRWSSTKVTMLWLETIERKRVSTGYDAGCKTIEAWQYRPLQDEKK